MKAKAYEAAERGGLVYVYLVYVYLVYVYLVYVYMGEREVAPPLPALEAMLCAPDENNLWAGQREAENAIAQAAADGLSSTPSLTLSDPQSEQRWPVNGTVRDLVIGDSRVRVRLEEEAWWINPNSASPALLEAMMRGAGSDGEERAPPGDRDRRMGRFGTSAAAAECTCCRLSSSGALDYGPPGAPLDTLDELGRVVGMTSATFAAVRHSGKQAAHRRGYSNCSRDGSLVMGDRP